MKCDTKTMLKTGGVIALILVGTLLMFPQSRPIIASIAPFALFALCPLSMIFMMADKNKSHKDTDQSKN